MGGINSGHRGNGMSVNISEIISYNLTACCTFWSILILVIFIPEGAKELVEGCSRSYVSTIHISHKQIYPVITHTNTYRCNVGINEIPPPSLSAKS